MRYLVLLLLVLVPATASADSPLMAAMNGLEWGLSAEEVLVHHREQIMENYRTDIAGIRDPIEIDRMRREAEDAYLEIETSAADFSGARTGFEVSVIQDEVRAESGQSMFSMRDDWSTYYYLFYDDRLQKMLVTYDQASMGFVGFEAFVERLESVLGGPTATDWEVDDIGVRHMTNASWEDEFARVRAEDKSDMFASFLLVYIDEALVEVPQEPRAVGRPARPGGSRDIGAMIRRIDETGTETRDNSNVVDGLLGSSTEVDLILPQDALPPDEGEAAAALDNDSAMDDEDELEDEERRERPTRTSSRDEDEDEDEDEGETDDGGEIIY